MGLIGEVVLLPFAPVRAGGWVIRQVLEEAERLYYDPVTVRAELVALEEQLTAGEIDEEEFDRREDELLDRLGAAVRLTDIAGEVVRGQRDAVAEEDEEAYEGEGEEDGDAAYAADVNGEYLDEDAEEPEDEYETEYAGDGSRR